MTCEVVVYNIESALKAQEGGADRIELCDNPAEGGTTPSPGIVEVVRQNISIDLYVMIRPRGGDFMYNRYEYHAMKRDIFQYQKLGVDGFVFGILNPDGTLDKARCKELIERAKPLKCTCHRAFDMTRDPFEALDDCIEVGFERILTSGQKPTALEGVGLISQLVESAGSRIRIMPGCGVNEETVKQIVSKTQATEIHFSSTSQRDSTMVFRNEAIAAMGEKGDSEFLLRTVDVERVRNMRRLAESVSG